MLCFVHQDVAAVASCKSCGRGACSACARLADLWVVCGDDCAVEAKRLQKTNLQASRLNAVASKPNYLLPLFFVLVGVALAMSVLFGGRDFDLSALLTAVIGLFMVGMGASFFARIRRLDTSLRSNEKDSG